MASTKTKTKTTQVCFYHGNCGSHLSFPLIADYEPPRKKSSKSSSADKGHGEAGPSEGPLDSSSAPVYLACQMCPSALRRVASLRKHYIEQHGYEPGDYPSSFAPDLIA